MFSFLSGFVVKQLADSGSLIFIKDQEQISPLRWGTALASSMSALPSVHTTDTSLGEGRFLWPCLPSWG